MTKAAEPAAGVVLPAGSRVGVIAGSGSLPADVADSLALQGLPPVVYLLQGEADRLDRLCRHEHFSAPVEEAAVAFDRMRAAGVTHAILAGGVERRPRFGNIRWTRRLLGVLPRLALALSRGDDSLLRVVLNHMEANGIRMVGAHEVVPDLLAAEGPMTRLVPSAADFKDIAAAQQAARAIGLLDIGQGAVAVGGRAIALEGIEGTQGLLERIVPLRGHGRLAGKTGGVLVKLSKPAQELRADLPAIGPDTVDQAVDAGLRGITVEAHRAFILDFKTTIERADEAGIFIFGIREEPA